MIEKLSKSSGNVLDYKLSGKITKEDYVTLTADVEALLQQQNSIHLLLDLETFKGEEIKAMGTKLGFRGDYRRIIPKMAIVGDKKWQKWLTAFIDPNYYERETQFFSSTEREAAWEWLQI